MILESRASGIPGSSEYAVLDSTVEQQTESLVLCTFNCGLFIPLTEVFADVIRLFCFFVMSCFSPSVCLGEKVTLERYLYSLGFITHSLCLWV